MRTSLKGPKLSETFREFTVCCLVCLAFMLGVAFAASAAHAMSTNGCDLQALRRYPMTDVLQTRTIPLRWPIIYFPAPGEKPSYDHSKPPDTAEERKWKEALVRGLKTFKPEERPVLMLADIDAWTDAKDGLLNFFILEQGIYLDEVLATLDSEGLDQYAVLFREGRALFGRDYGTQSQRYYRWSNGSGTILDPVLDAGLKDLSARYRALPRLLDVAVTRIAASPNLVPLHRGFDGLQGW